MASPCLGKFQLVKGGLLDSLSFEIIEVTQEVEIPRIMQGMFYSMVSNDTIELIAFFRIITRVLEDSLENLSWHWFEAWLDIDRA